MSDTVYNPYLPLNEYIPDGEPHVFDGRIYVYGSHDEARGTIFCPRDYEVYSAPVDDLTDWASHGISYRKEQDPSNPDGKMQLWAPDVTKGPNGRYYLYYCLSMYPEIGVAVSDSPAGPFTFYGHVKKPSSETLHDDLPFDPGVLTDEDGHVYLYYGFAPAPPRVINWLPCPPSPGCMFVELEPDMLTIKNEPKPVLPSGANSAGTGFEGHAFYEASSIRKINDTYYLIYSSELSHELCYATSAYPDRDFVFGGTIVSNGDIGFNGNQHPVAMTGNTHGSIEQVNGQWYVFYHRQTHATESSRQGCAEKIAILEDGSIPQVEITSCGLNKGPLPGSGVYPAAIACHLTNSATSDIILYGQDMKQKIPYIYEAEDGQIYNAHVTDGTVFGFKYFELENLQSVSLTLRGTADGQIQVYTENPELLSPKEQEEKCLGQTEISLSEASLPDEKKWQTIRIDLTPAQTGTLPLYFRYTGTGACDVQSLIL